jgi:ribosomal protein L39E
MSRNKDKELKDSLRSQRKRMGTGFTGAPVWVMQKKGARIWNLKAKRNWRQTDMGHVYRNSIKN